MALKIEPATVEELETEFGTSTSGNDPDTVAFIRTLAIGGGFNVTAEDGETDRQVKRRINACAKEGFRELDWRTRATGGLAARVKAIDVEEEKKWTEAQEMAAKEKAEEAAKKAAEEEAQKAAKEALEKAQASEGGTPPDGSGNAPDGPPDSPDGAPRKRQPATV